MRRMWSLPLKLKRRQRNPMWGVKKSHRRKPSRSQPMHQRYGRPEPLWKRLRLCRAGAPALEAAPEQRLCAPSPPGQRGVYSSPRHRVGVRYGGLGPREIPALTLQVQGREEVQGGWVLVVAVKLNATYWYMVKKAGKNCTELHGNWI